MNALEYCGGNPCEDAQALVKSDETLTKLLGTLSGVAFEVLDAGAKIAEITPSAQSLIDATITGNQGAYDAISASRDLTRSLIAQYCAGCPGLVEGACPTLAAE